MASSILKARLPITKTVQATATVGANTNARLTATAPTVGGYTPVGIIGILSSAGAAGTITEFRLTDGNPTSVVRNAGSTQISVTYTYTILYLPN